MKTRTDLMSRVPPSAERQDPALRRAVSPPVRRGQLPEGAGDVIRVVRLLLPAAALVVMLLPVPYVHVGEYTPGHVDGYGLSFWETVDLRRLEVRWLLLPVTAALLILWERVGTRRTRGVPGVAGPWLRMSCFVVVTWVIARSQGAEEPMVRLTWGVGKLVVMLCALSMIAGIATEIVLTHRARRRG